MKIGDLVKWLDSEAIGVIIGVAGRGCSTKFKVLWGSGVRWYYAYELEKI
tara:strand:+ start:118 stop:267 length:150 start_codon:yes stop_codon:yes gene_type:complete